MTVRRGEGDILKGPADALLLGAFSDVKPFRGRLGGVDWVMCASVSRLWKARPGLLGFGHMSLLATQGKIPIPGVLLVGLGDRSRFDREMRREAFRLGLLAARGMGVTRLGVGGIALDPLEPEELALLDCEQAAGELAASAPSDILLFRDEPSA